MIVEDAQFEAGIKGCRVTLEACPAFVSRVSGELLYRCFENVIRNAVRYTRPAPQCGVAPGSISRRKRLSVQITDQGPGVENSRCRAFFTRSSAVSASQRAALAWAWRSRARAVEMHGGTIVARNEPSGGLTVEIQSAHRA